MKVGGIISGLVVLVLVGLISSEVIVEMQRHSTNPELIQFSITNLNTETFTFLSYKTPFEGMLADMFDVSFEGEPVEYIGPVARRVSPPSLRSYINLLPRNTLSVQVNISANYNIKQSGEYIIKASKIEAFSDLEVAEITLFLTPFSRLFNKKEGNSFYTNCNSLETSQINGALPTAITQSKNGYNKMNGVCGSLCTTWFGAYNANNYDYDLIMFQNIEDQLSTSGINAYCNPNQCSSGVYAFVYPSDPLLTVYLCDAFWSQANERANTIVHEMSHFNAMSMNNVGTNDYAYGRVPCKNLASNNPYQASHNADNVCYFSEDA